MTPAERLAWLLETVEQPTGKLVTFSDITALPEAGMAGAALVVGTIKAAAVENPLMDTVLLAMSTGGLSLSTPERQAVLDQLAAAGSWAPEMTAAIKQLGVRSVPRWQLETSINGVAYVTEPTLTDMEREAAVEGVNTQAATLIGKANAANSAALVAFDNGLTAAEITAAGEAELV